MKSNPERLLGNNTIADVFGDKDPRYKLVNIGGGLESKCLEVPG